MTENKTSEAQLRATKKWKEKNKEKTEYTRYKSFSKIFINKYSKLEDLDILEEYIKERRKELKQ